MQDLILLTELSIRYGLAFRLENAGLYPRLPNIAVQTAGVVGFILNFLVMSIIRASILGDAPNPTLTLFSMWNLTSFDLQDMACRI